MRKGEMNWKLIGIFALIIIGAFFIRSRFLAVSCTSDYECAENEYCDLICRLARVDGSGCNADRQCLSHNCVNLKCVSSEPVCGNGICDSGENSISCPQDCGDRECIKSGGYCSTINSRYKCWDGDISDDCGEGYVCKDLGYGALTCEPITVKCFDSDGEDYKSQGYVEVVGVKSYDKCTADGDYVMEWYCPTEESTGELKNKKCSDYGINWYCKDGACVALTCTDSDGRNFKTPGYITINGKTLKDRCSTDGSIISEQLCANNLPDAESKYCSDYGANWYCKETEEGGACVEYKCTDSDNLDFKSKGYIQLNGDRWYDECSWDGAHVLEWTCDPSVAGGKIVNKKCSDYGVSWYCEDGACVSLECFDSDGEDYKTFGFITLNGQRLEDKCSEDGTIISEQLCKDNLPDAKTKYCSDFGTGWFCKDGACRPFCQTDTDCDESQRCKEGACVESKCSDCGEGLFNICDEIECSNLDDCEFIPSVLGVGGKCIPKVNYCASCFGWLFSKFKSEGERCVSEEKQEVNLIFWKIKIPLSNQDDFCPIYLAGLFGIILLVIGGFIYFVRKRPIKGGRRK